MHKLAFFLAAAVCLPFSLNANAGELELGIYSGYNQSNNSRGTLSDGVVEQSTTIDWDGVSFERPPYYGVRALYWPDGWENFGLGVDFTHLKVAADLSAAGVAGNYDRLEFTDGLNVVTANALYKREVTDNLRGYLGAGLGVSVPHVEVDTTASTVTGESSTFEYQLAGPAVQLMAGASYEFADNWRIFAEYKFNYTWNEAELDGGGTFSTDIATHQLLAGVSYSFDFLSF